MSHALPPIVVPVRVDPPYPVIVGTGLLPRIASLLEDHGVAMRRHVALVSDTTVARLHGAAVRDALAAAGARVTSVTVAPGERSKSLASVADACSALARANLDRGGLVVALGGGVIGDLAGFVAAAYLRGLPFVQLPTTLLAMVDASVGGKTGVNLPEGKNLVGAFPQPLAVVADTALLATLPERTFREGGVELVKAGWLGDPGLAEAFLAATAASATAAAAAATAGVLDQPWAPDVPPLPDLIARAIEVKADVVAADPHEAGVRAHLNLGHTLAHALETASDHALPHGEAVAYGLAFAAALGAGRGWYDWRGDAAALLAWLRPRPLPEVPFETLRALMARDKKRVGDRLRFVLLRQRTEPVVVDDVDDEALVRAWRALREVADAVDPERP